MNEYTFSQLKTGMKASFKREITKGMEDGFRAISGDENPLHWNDSFALGLGEYRKFRSHVTFGMLTASLLSALAGMYLPGKYSLIHSVEKISFKSPVYAGDILTVTGTIMDKQDGLKLILLKVKTVNQDGETVMTAVMKVLVLK